MMGATNEIINETIKDDNMNETKNDEETTDKNDLRNTNDDDELYQSEFSSRLEEIGEKKQKLNDEQEPNKLLQQRANEQRRHKEAMSSKQAQLNVLTNNNNNNDDEMVSIQANYQIEEDNRNEEREMDKRIQCAQVVKSIHELKDEKDPNGSVWELTLYHYRFPYVEKHKQLNDITLIDELNEIKATYEQAIATAPKHTIEFKSKFHEKPKQEVFEEEEEESPTVIELSNINELSEGFEEVAIEDGDEINDEPSNIDPQSSEKPKRVVNTMSFKRKPQ